ncbi:hypothetical protein GCM10010319_61900 [Streptomyces blastmyceticus]|uniref:Uncharacterized protein n=1 Tax=Streptomyces blastmyceticus TaxID=68180 RepID=A0ABN0XXC5_9ACTN
MTIFFGADSNVVFAPMQSETVTGKPARAEDPEGAAPASSDFAAPPPPPQAVADRATAASTPHHARGRITNTPELDIRADPPVRARIR